MHGQQRQSPVWSVPVTSQTPFLLKSLAGDTANVPWHFLP